jgi:hypothetical protein
MKTMKTRWLFSIIIAVGTACLALYGSAPLFLPQPKPASVEADQFSAERAMQHVKALAQGPRIVGTAGMERAVAYLTASLNTCQLDAEIQQMPSQRGILQNVIVRIPGYQPGNAILLLTHTDSVSIGAGDNATGAANLIEVACSLKATGMFKNDIILLFEDGEEAGYLGGYAFAKSDPSIETISDVIAMDTAAWGPVVLLQTTPANERFIRAYAESAVDPIAFGFFADADWKISQDTSEIQPFYEVGIPGIDFEDPTAFSGKHSNADTIQHVNIGSLQQMGDQVLALARSMADSDLKSTSDTNLSYFSLWGIGLIQYQATWNIAFAILSAIGLIAFVIKQGRQGFYRYQNVAISTLFTLLALIGSVFFGLIACIAFTKLFPNPNPNTGSYLIPASLPFFLAILLSVGCGYGIVRKVMTKHFGIWAVNISGLLCWLFLAIASAIFLQVGSYIFTIPLLVAIFVSFLPGVFKQLWILPAAISVILSSPNLVLAFLGTGMETLLLVSLLVVLNIELWSIALSSMRARNIRLVN